MSARRTQTNSGQEAYHRWYEKNREALNKRRRQRYQSDAKYRQRVRENSKKFQDKRRAEEGDTPDTRVVQGQRVQVFSITEVAEMIGRTAGTIRQWESQGIIPHPTIEGTWRRYTKHQTELLRWMCAKADEVTSKHDKKMIYDECSVRVLQEWEKL